MHLIMQYTTYHLVEEYVSIALITSWDIELHTAILSWRNGLYCTQHVYHAYDIYTCYVMFMTCACFDVYNYIEYATTSKQVGFEMDI